MQIKYISKIPSDSKNVVIAFGSYDLLHVGHLQHLRMSKTLGDYLVVGVASDNLIKNEKGKLPVTSTYERIEIVSSLEVVDGVFIEESLNKKEKYIRDMKASTFVVGEEWLGFFDYLQPEINVVYLPRFPFTSTTSIIQKIKEGDFR